MSSPATQQPTPQLFFQTINAYQRTKALQTAIELEIFTAVGEGKATASEIATSAQASERGIRSLCDFLCIMGFLTKEGERYSLTPDSATFLDKRSPAYFGGATEFLLSPMLINGFEQLTEAVRKGGTAISDEGAVSPENPVWVKFARAMAPMTLMPSQAIVQLVDPAGQQRLKVLDIAAGHGLYGIAFGKNNRQAEIVAVDWPNVLEVAKENAQKAGIADRYSTIPGNAFDVDYGTGYDVALITNFLHHFDPENCEKLLRKVHSSLAEGGRAVTLEFIPNEDRISPPDAAGFSLMMLVGTPGGDAYTFSDLDRMLRTAGFSRNEIHPLPGSIQHVVISQK
jgi:SAM-dependent methyltransferase